MTNKNPTPADAGRLVRKTSEVIDKAGWVQGTLEGVKLSRKFTVGLDFAFCGEDSLFEDLADGFNTEFVKQTTGYCIAGGLNYTYCGNAVLTRNRIDKIPLLKLTYELLDEFLKEFYLAEISPREAAVIAEAVISNFQYIEGFNDRIAKDKAQVLTYLHKFADLYDPQKV